MNAFQPCRNTSDCVPLYLPQQLYLKPAARLTISIQLPNIKKLEKSISHWEIMEKLRTLIRPDEFSVLKVSKTTLNFVRFEAELENRTRLDRVVSKLDNNSIKLKEIPDLLRLKASEVKSDFPTRHKWDSFFQEAKDMDEMKPGQRPDTVHLSNLPRKWFVPYHLPEGEDVVPSEKLFYRIFEKFGQIRYVDIPVCDPYRKKMKDHISGIKAHPVDDRDFFEGYVQFKDYIGFTKTMDALKGMKLVRKEEDEAFCVNIKVDFDRSKHLSDASIRRREIVRDRLVKKQREKEEKEKNELDAKKSRELDERQKEVTLKSEKEQRRREREEKRKARLLEKLKINSCDEINDKIAKEEKKLLKAQRKLESIRLVEELFRRIKEKKEELHMYSKTKSSSGDELKRFKDMSELEVLTQRQKLHNAIEGRVVLKNILSRKKKSRSRSSSSSDTSLSLDEDRKDRNIPEVVYDPTWYNYPIYVYPPRGRYPLPGPSRGRPPFRGRGFRPRYRGGFRGKYSHYSPEMEEQYMRYFSKFFSEHDRRSRSRSKSVDSSKFVSPRSSRRRSKSWSMPRSGGEKGRSWSKTPSQSGKTPKIARHKITGFCNSGPHHLGKNIVTPTITPSPIVQTVRPTTNPIPVPTIPTASVATTKCQEYKHRIKRRASVVTYIFGGSASRSREFPHMAALGYGQPIEWLCGGSLISERFVLTAAHCLATSNLGELVRVRLGDLDLQSVTDDAQPQDYRVSQKIIHPSYHAPAQYDDIALIRLDRDVQFSPYIAPICLETQKNLPNYNFIATGWGKTEVGGSQSDILMKVDLEYFSNQICRQNYANVGSEYLSRGVDDNSQICAGSRKDGKDTCQGDSGGPLQIRTDVLYLVGITSFGKICGIPNSPGVYTRVSYYIPWIERIVWPQ
ncbi:hypothetical protein TcasGA2_TC031075 [Tribolium castaneum]|uniref:Peptidase S1 domain-containing protein n=1 Tax=Tribolium castaneum TaxID=7070 RepID=A0A139WAV7_TRICA|nr:hypothetical protein TcasGA2_TC031075 [Tribolium castaneum]